MSEENFELKANQLLHDLGQFLNLGELEFDPEDDTCTLVLDDTLEINITPNSESGVLVLHHLVGILPQENRQDILEQLLEANLFWAGTKGATISIERRSGSVFIMRSLTLYTSDGEPLNGEAFGNVIADIAGAAKYARSLLVPEAPYTLTSEEDQDGGSIKERFDVSILN
jgi:hypothetical protein